MHPARSPIFPEPAASSTRRAAADVKADRRSPAGSGLDPDEDRRTLTTAGTANTQITFTRITCIMPTSARGGLEVLPSSETGPLSLPTAPPTKLQELLHLGEILRRENGDRVERRLDPRNDVADVLVRGVVVHLVPPDQQLLDAVKAVLVIGREFAH
jgi:hypothetical protein